MTPYEIPLSPTPQSFTIPLAGATYRLTVKWCAASASWTLDIADAADNAILSGIPLVTGADLLAQYGHLGIGGQLIVQTDTDPDAVPSFDDLGVTGHLYFVVPS